jgi:hypothetical protein
LWWFYDIDPGPGPVEYVLVEELQAIAITFDGGPGTGANQGIELGSELGLGDVSGVGIEEFAQASYGARIGIDGFVGFALALERVNMLTIGRVDLGLL